MDWAKNAVTITNRIIKENEKKYFGQRAGSKAKGIQQKEEYDG